MTLHALRGTLRRLAAEGPAASYTGALADMVAGLIDIKPSEKQTILESLKVRDRLDRVIEFLTHRVEVLKLSKEIGEQTQGSAGVQRLVKLPQDRGLWLTWAQYLTADGKPIHEEGLKPDVVVEEPNYEFSELPPAGDPMLDKAIETARKNLNQQVR